MVSRRMKIRFMKKPKKPKKKSKRKWAAFTQRMQPRRRIRFTVINPLDGGCPSNISRYIQSISKGIEGMHYEKGLRTLLIGEGDFAFAQCLAHIVGLREELVATTLETELETYRKYPHAREIVETLRSMGIMLLFEVDGKRFYREPWAEEKFDKITFNFPHVGGGSLDETVMTMRTVLKLFFKQCRRALRENGKVHVALRDTPFYERWQIKRQADIAGFTLEKSTCWVDPPGYESVRTYGSLVKRKSPTHDALLHTFVVKGKLRFGKKKKKTAATAKIGVVLGGK